MLRAIVGGAWAVAADEALAGRRHRLPELVPDLVYYALVPYLGQEEALHRAGIAARRHRV